MLMIITALSVASNPQVQGKATEALQGLIKHKLISNLDEVKRSAAQAALNLAAAEEKMKEEARARQGDGEGEGDEGDEGEEGDEEDDEDVEHIDLEKKAKEEE